MHLDISDTAFLSGDMVPILGAINRNTTLKRFILRDLPLDEPSCLQAAHGFSSSTFFLPCSALPCPCYVMVVVMVTLASISLYIDTL